MSKKFIQNSILVICPKKSWFGKCDRGEFVCSGNRSHQPFPAHHQARENKQAMSFRGAPIPDFLKKIGISHFVIICFANQVEFD